MISSRRSIPLLVGIALLLCSGCGKPEWKEFSSDGGGYTVLFPGTPEHKTRNVPTPAGNIALNAAAVELRDVAYTVMYSDMPAMVLTIPAKQLLEGAKQGMTTKGVTWKQAQDITVEGHPGLEMLGTSTASELAGKQNLRVRVILVKTKMYQIMIGGRSEGDVTDADADKFFASFKLK